MAAITLEGESLIAQYMANPESVALNIDQMVFAYVPDIDYTDEIDRDQGMPLSAYVKVILPITHAGKLNNNLVVYSTVMDSTIGTWNFNWIGLYSSEDEKMVVVAYVPEQEKRKTVGDLLGNVMTKNIAVEFNGAADLTGINIDAESWQIDYTARLRSMDHVARSAMQTIYGKSAYQQNAFKVKYASSKYYLTQGQAVIGGLDFSLNTDYEITVGTLPATVWLDVYQTQTMSSVENVFDVVVNNGTVLTDYTSPTGMKHTVVKLGVITSTSNILDNRDLIVGSLKIDPNVTQQEAESGTGTAARKWSVMAVWQAIAAWWATIGTTFGKSILNSANAGEARTILNAVSSDDGRLSNQRDWNAVIVAKLDAEAGIETIARKWTAERVKQAIAALAKHYSFPAGTKMIFAQATAPIGWVKDTTHNNKALRVVSGTTGGAATGEVAFTDAFASARAVTVSVANHTLSLSQAPSHTHTVFSTVGADTNVLTAPGGTYRYAKLSRGVGNDNSYILGGSTTYPTSGLTSDTGGGGVHNHSATGSVNLNVQKVDVIICTKE